MPDHVVVLVAASARGLNQLCEDGDYELIDEGLAIAFESLGTDSTLPDVGTLERDGAGVIAFARRV